MRIRTIKPEFWTSETMASVSDKSKLLAIGLLNFCDDEGYFLANPLLIRAAIFPFLDESKTLLGLLDELSKTGYIQLGNRTDDRRMVGRVVNFTLHQRIDKPKPSIIKENVQFLDSSTTSLGVILDKSQGERKGKEGNGTGKERESDASLSLADIQKVLDEWNASAQKSGLPQCLLVSDKRRRTLAVRLRDEFFKSNWRKAISRVSASKFCLGESERGWRATFDWFITPDAVVKIMEGKYDSVEKQPVQQQGY